MKLQRIQRIRAYRKFRFGQFTEIYNKEFMKNIRINKEFNEVLENLEIKDKGKLYEIQIIRDNIYIEII